MQLIFFKFTDRKESVSLSPPLTYHMACTDTGLKMCILPAVLTLKPLMERGKIESKTAFLCTPTCLLQTATAHKGQKNQDENFSH